MSFKPSCFHLKLENIGYIFILNKFKNKLLISPIILKAQIGRQYLEITEFCVYFFRIWLTNNTANYFKHRRRFSINKKFRSHLSFLCPNVKENFVIHFIGSFSNSFYWQLFQFILLVVFSIHFIGRFSIHFIGSFFNSFYWQFFQFILFEVFPFILLAIFSIHFIDSFFN